MTSVSFTDNLSDAIAFSGVVKIKCDDIPENGAVQLLEERNDTEYELVNALDPMGNTWGAVGYGETSRLFELYGNYKIKRTHPSISVGYEAA